MSDSFEAMQREDPRVNEFDNVKIFAVRVTMSVPGLFEAKINWLFSLPRLK